MAYNTSKLYAEAVKIITEDEDIHFIEDVVCGLGVSKSTFYQHFPKESNESNELKELLSNNATKKKRKLRKKWDLQEGGQLTQISLYKLLATREELARLNNKDLEQDKTEGDTHIENFKPLE